VIGLLDENARRPGLFTASPSSKARRMLQEFADVTGGTAYFPKTIEEVEALCKEIAHDLRNRYTIGFRPANDKTSSQWHDVHITIAQSRPAASRFVIRARPGYYER